MENKLMRNKWFLYITEFFAGVSVMAVELLGMQVLDELIDSELRYYKEQFSLREIIDMVA